VEYALVFTPKGKKGFTELARFNEIHTEDELIDKMQEPGTYMYRKLVNNKIVEANVWAEPYRVVGEEVEVVEKPGSERKLSSDELAAAIEADFERWNRWRILKSVLDGKVESGGSSGGTSDFEKMLDTLTKFKEKFDSVAPLLGYTKQASVGEADKIPVSGTVPASLVYAPKFVKECIKEVREEIKGMASDILAPPKQEELSKMPKLPDLKGEKK
jgi:hypothetical protein